MKKSFWLALGLAMGLLTLGAREWVLNQELNDLRSAVISQLREHVSNANSISRLRELQEVATVYSRYLEPLLLVSSRMIWGPTRSDIVISWRREVQTELEEQISKKTSDFEATFRKEMNAVRMTETPSLKRLSSLVRICEEKSPTLICSTIMDEELAAIQKTAAEKDQGLLAAIKTEGVLRLKELKTQLTSKSSKQIALYLTSGKYHRAIEKPITDLIMNLKQNELRKSAWNEFEKKRDEILSHKKAAVARANEPRPDIAKKGIERVTDPVTQALQLDSYFGREETEAPSDSGTPPHEEWGSPSAADSQN